MTVVALIGVYFKCKNVKCQSSRRLEGKTAIVTGGTAGMGLEVAIEFAKRGAKLIVACPFEEEGVNGHKTIIEKSGNKNVTFKLLDLASLASVRDFANEILQTEDRLDILVNNAGVLQPDKSTADGMNFVMQVNYFGHFLLTLLLLPLLKRSGQPSDPSRIVNVTSSAHANGTADIDNLNLVGYKFHFKAYANSKLCLTMFTQELSKRLIEDNVVVNSADPAVAATGIADGYDILPTIFKYTVGHCYPSARDGAQTAMHIALDQKAGEVSGEYFENCKLSKSGKNAKNDTLSQMLWAESIKIVKLDEEELRLCLK